MNDDMPMREAREAPHAVVSGVGHYENFPVASLLVPAAIRPAVVAIYRFARAADDVADEGDAPDEQRLSGLEAFRAGLRDIEVGETPRDAILHDLALAVRRHGLSMRWLHDLLDAFAQDVRVRRYDTFDALLGYCERSANPVGRLMLALYDADTPAHRAWSDAICSGLQIANFLQDVAVDWAKGRVYLPREDLDRFGVSERDIEGRVADARWAALMRFEADRTRRMLESGRPLGRAVGGRVGLELRLVVAGGLRILDRIDAVAGDVFRRRPVLGRRDWAAMFLSALF
jgi:squalene synthase HpnC